MDKIKISDAMRELNISRTRIVQLIDAKKLDAAQLATGEWAITNESVQAYKNSRRKIGKNILA